MILSAHSSAEEMVPSIMVNDPGKHFPILRNTIQLIQSLKKKENEIGIIPRKQNFKKKEKGEKKYSYTRN